MPPQSRQDRLVGRALANRRHERRLAVVDLVEEEVLLRREVVEDGLLRDARGLGDLGYLHALEAALDEEAQRGVGDGLPCLSLLELAQAHVRSVTRFLQLRQ